MTDIDIDAIRRREQAATEGPWSLRDGWGPARDGLARCSRIANKQHDNVLHPEGRDIAGTVADLEFIAAARTDAPALLAKVDELTAERDLNGDLLDGTARALGLDLEDPDVHYAFNIPTKVAELTAALTKSRELADTRAVELADVWEHLTAANRRADGLEADLRSANTANTAWANETAAKDAVVEAAKAWRQMRRDWRTTPAPDSEALIDAVDALPESEVAR